MGLQWVILVLVAHLTLDINYGANADRSVPSSPFQRAVLPGRLQKVAVRSDLDEVFIGGTNAIYKLNPSTLEVERSVPIGPLNDNILCPPLNEECSAPRQSTDNEVRILLVIASNTPPRLLACGSAYQGMCTILSTERLTASFVKGWTLPWFGSGNTTRDFVASKRTSVAFFGSSGGFRRTLYSGFEYDGRPMGLTPPFISARRVRGSGLAYAVEDGDSFTTVELNSRFKHMDYRTKFLYGFDHDGFSYFLMVKQLGEGPTGFNTKLGRVCQDDEKFFSYMEVPLVCTTDRGDINYELATAAHFGKIGSYKWVDLDIKSEEESEVLYISFGSAMLNDQVDSRKGSLVCGFSMKKIREIFDKNYEECYKGHSRLKTIESIAGHQTQCAKAQHSGKPYCDSGLNPHIDGYFAIHGHQLMHLENETVSAIAVTMQRGNQFRPTVEAIAVIGTESGRVLKVRMEQEKILFDAKPFQSERNNQTAPILSSIAFDNSSTSLYLLSGNEVLKFPIANCSIYADCGSCLSSGDPLKCVWCGDRCSLSNECTSGEQRETCPPKIIDFYPRSGPIQGGTQIVIQGENLGHYVPNSPNFEATISVAGFSCRPLFTNWTSRSVVCEAGEVSHPREGPIHLMIKSLKRGTTRLYDIEGTAVSKYDYFYKKLEINGIEPCWGPKSGNTSLSILGENLDVGSSKQVAIGGIQCNVASFTKKSLTCITGKSDTRPLNRQHLINITIDNFTYTLKRDKQKNSRLCQTFEYRPDPIITRMEPHGTIEIGNTKITVHGDNLDSVARPRMILEPLFPPKDNLIIDCTNHFKKMMFCFTPQLPRNAGHPTMSAPTQYKVGFLMDNNDKLRTLGSDKPQDFYLKYYPVPKFEEFDSSQPVIIEDAVITIKGENISDAYQVAVLLDGQYICDENSSVQVYNPNTMFCDFDLNATQFSLNDYHTVEVEVAGSKTQIGQIYFEEKGRQASTAWVAIYILAILCIIIGAALVALYFLKKSGYIFKEKQCPPMNVIFTSGPSSSMEPNTPGSQNVYGLGGSRARDSSEPLILSRFLRIGEERKRQLEREKLLYDRDLLDLGEIIGQGHFGCVYHGTLKLNGKEDPISVAVKTLRNSLDCYDSESDIEAFIQEGEMMKDFKHHNVLTLIGFCFEEDGSPMVLTPYMANGDLLSYIRNENNAPFVRDLITWGVQIAGGMKYLAGLHFVHRDLAARNCMLDEHLVVKVADFGLSRDVYERDYYSSENRKQKLPIKWMAPESIEKGSYTTKSDVWSYGVTLWELMTRGVMPYAAVDNWEVLNYLKQGHRMAKPSYCPDQLYEIMLRCWAMDPKIRPPFEELEEEVAAVITRLEMNSSEYSRRAPTNVTYINVDIPEYVTQMPEYPDVPSNLPSPSNEKANTTLSGFPPEDDGYLRPLKSPSPFENSATSF